VEWKKSWKTRQVASGRREVEVNEESTLGIGSEGRANLYACMIRARQFQLYDNPFLRIATDRESGMVAIIIARTGHFAMLLASGLSTPQANSLSQYKGSGSCGSRGQA
jgi:hypothetical protein